MPHTKIKDGILSTGDAARFLRISSQKVRNLVDFGQVPSFKTPLSKLRFIPVEGLYAFMKTNSIATDLLLAEFPDLATKEE